MVKNTLYRFFLAILLIGCAGSAFGLSMSGGSSGGGGGIDPNTTLFMKDDFCLGTDDALQIGELRWRVNASSTVHITGDATRPCYQRLNTGVTIGEAATLYLSERWLPYGSDFVYVAKFRAYTDVPDARYAVGFSDAPFGASVVGAAGVFLYKDFADTTWKCVTVNDALTVSAVDTGVTVVQDEFISLQIRKTAADTVGCSINGGAEVTRTLTHSASFKPMIRVETNVAASRRLEVDYLDFTINSLSR